MRLNRYMALTRILMLALCLPALQAEEPYTPPVALKGYSEYSPKIKELVRRAFDLDAAGLKYRFGSATPDQGGMDCSGTIHYLLKTSGWDGVPRQSDGFYRWSWQADTFHAVNGVSFQSFEWQALKPGDLLFWTGTYSVDSRRDPPISHVMLYLGEEEGTGRKLMFGASENRPYKDTRKSGVGVFDLYLPNPEKSSARFVGYGSIPGLEKLEEPPLAVGVDPVDVTSH